MAESIGKFPFVSGRACLSMFKTVLVSSVWLLASACTNLAYYAQSVGGHMQLMAAARPIGDVVDDALTDPVLRQQLARAGAIREFASSELALPNNDSYRSYADLGRPYVVWNVFAAPELSVEPQQWCLMFVGCVKYRGYYDQRAANLYAEELRQAGADTFVRGVLAYSTLGFFNDPLLNTFLRLGDINVARIVFHELAHHVVFVKGDSAFNESFATTVELEGLRRWLSKSGQSERLQDLELQQGRRAQFHQLVSDIRMQLREIYASSMAPDAKRRAKAEALTGIRQTYARLKAGWGNSAEYDHWFSQPLNNAALGSIVLYTQWVPAFNALLEQEGGNLPRFYQRVAALALLPQSAREAALEQLSPKDLPTVKRGSVR